MKPIVFLDIDGVLNTSKNYHEWNMANSANDIWVPDADDPFILKLFDPINVAHLNTLTTCINAEIVVSSSWRMLYKNDFNKLRDILISAGVVANIIGTTPTIIPEREGAIQAWLLGTCKKEVPAIILDDDNRFIELRPWLVEVSQFTGFIERDIDIAIKKLEVLWRRS